MLDPSIESEQASPGVIYAYGIAEIVKDTELFPEQVS